MPKSDFVKWSKPEQIGELVKSWVDGLNVPNNGSFAVLKVKNGAVVPEFVWIFTKMPQWSKTLLIARLIIKFYKKTILNFSFPWFFYKNNESIQLNPNQILVPKRRLWIIFCPPSKFHWGAMCPIPLKVTNIKLLASSQTFPAFWGPLSAWVVNQGLKYPAVGSCNSCLIRSIQKRVPLVGTAGSLSPE